MPRPMVLTVSMSSSSFLSSTKTLSFSRRDFYWSSLTRFCSARSFSCSVFMSRSRPLFLWTCFSFSSWYPLSIRSSCWTSRCSFMASSLVSCSLPAKALKSDSLTVRREVCWSCVFRASTSSSRSLILLPWLLPSLRDLLSASSLVIFCVK